MSCGELRGHYTQFVARSCCVPHTDVTRDVRSVTLLQIPWRQGSEREEYRGTPANALILCPVDGEQDDGYDSFGPPSPQGFSLSPAFPLAERPIPARYETPVKS